MNNKIKLGSLEINCFISGSNPLNGYSHQSKEKDKEMSDYFTFERMLKYLHQCEENGIDTIVARMDKLMIQLFKEYWLQGGKIKWIGQTAREYGSVKQNITEGIKAGVSALFIHGGTVDQHFREGIPEKLIEYVKYAKSFNLPVGVASHNPDCLLKLQDMDCENDFFLLSLYNINGYLGKKEISSDEKFDDQDRKKALQILHSLKRPCILYKILGAGRKNLSEALIDISDYIRKCDGIMIGMYTKENENLIQENTEQFYKWRANLFVQQ
ncbi:MAG: hypothetical protein ACLSVG_06260 [Clostridia bacterium]